MSETVSDGQTLAVAPGTSTSVSSLLDGGLVSVGTLAVLDLLAGGTLTTMFDGSTGTLDIAGGGPETGYGFEAPPGPAGGTLIDNGSVTATGVITLGGGGEGVDGISGGAGASLTIAVGADFSSDNLLEFGGGGNFSGGANGAALIDDGMLTNSGTLLAGGGGQGAGTDMAGDGAQLAVAGLLVNSGSILLGGGGGGGGTGGVGGSGATLVDTGLVVNSGDLVMQGGRAGNGATRNGGSDGAALIDDGRLINTGTITLDPADNTSIMYPGYAGPPVFAVNAGATLVDDGLIVFDPDVATQPPAVEGTITLAAGATLLVGADGTLFNPIESGVLGQVAGTGLVINDGEIDNVELSVPTVVNDGTIIGGAIDGNLVAGIGGSGTLAIAASGDVTITGTVGAGETVAFNAPAGTFGLEQPLAFGGAITGFTGDDTIILPVNYAPDDTATYDDATGILAITSGGETIDLALAFAPGTAHEAMLASYGGEILVEVASPCFAADTLLDTPSGPRAVQSLAPGDVVSLHRGGAAPIRWIGRRRLVDAHMVRVCAHALGAAMPRRDLVVSHDHALLVDGVLVPAALLADGDTVVAERWPSATLFHVELDAHDILSAEGAPAESYLDTGNRAQFANCPIAYDPAAPAPEPCAELVVAGARLEQARASLQARIPA